MSDSIQPVLLVIRDGWGANHNGAHDAFNAVKLAQTPVSDKLSAECSRTELMAHGPDVGLPEGIMGNSEVGHQNIGAGRIVDQELVRINKGIAQVADNAVFKAAVAQARSGGKLHLMGLVSDAGVHAMLEHLYGLLQAAKDAGLNEVYIHAFTDGRDTPPTSGKGYIEALEARCAQIGIGRIASVCGRFYAMDRDLRWNRVQPAYDCLTGRAVAATATSASQAVAEYYENPSEPTLKGDEFVPPTQIVDDEGRPVAVVEDGDALLFFNYRGDRPRELTRAFIEEGFDGFDRGEALDLYFATMTEYQKGLCPNVLFPKPPKMINILGAYVADKGIAQFRCAETEKFPHVTFFFNDYREEPFPGEDRALIPSPKEVSTYDQKPEMSAAGVTAATEEAIRSGKYGLIVVNYANADMVGHTGSLEAAMASCEAVDRGLGVLLKAAEATGFVTVVTADHGNSDQMFDPEQNGPHTAHTLNPVELVVTGPGTEGLKLRQSDTRLGDIAPTLVQLMGLPIPTEMTGKSLIES